MRSATWFVRAAALYNASAVVVFLTPGLLEWLSVLRPDSEFWLWLPSLLGLYGAIVLALSSMDLQQYAAFPYWNGIIRFVFVVAVVSLNLARDLGPFIVVLVVGDLILALGCVVVLPRVVGRSHWSLLTNKRHVRSPPAPATGKRQS